MKTISKEVIKVGLIILIISIIWLVFSERIILFFLENAEKVNKVQRGKGLLFILTFSLLIYVFIKGEVRRNILQCEKKLADEKSKKDYLFESVNDAIFILDEKSKFVDCNAMTLQLFKCTKDQIIGISPSDLSPKYQPNGIESVQLAKEKIEVARKGEKQIFEWIHSNIDKTEEFLTEVSINSKIISEKEYIITVVRDISERTKKESANMFSYEVVGMANDGEEFLKIKNVHKADIILMDIQMPNLNGIETVKKALWEYQFQKFIAITNYTDSAYLLELISAGFAGCVFKYNIYDELENAINAVRIDQLYFPNDIIINKDLN